MRQENVRRIISIAAVVVMVIIFSATTGGAYLSPSNLLNIFRECGVIGIISAGVAMVIITAGIDLSTGALVGFCGMFSNYLLYVFGLPGIVIIPVSLLLGALCGALNGFIVTKLRVPEFVGTLSTQYLFRSMVFVFAIREQGVIVNKRIKDDLITGMGEGIGGVYFVSIAFVVVVIIGQIILKKTRFGTYIYATGANRKSAELSGVPVEKIRFAVHTITGLLCGFACLFSMGRIGSVTTDFGTGLEFSIISAVVIGGCAFSGGRGDCVGAAIGTLFMACLQNGILKYNIPPALQLVIRGTVIVVMIIFDSVYNKHLQKNVIRRAREREDKMMTGVTGNGSAA